MTVESPGAHKLKRISQNIYVAGNKMKKNENFNFDHGKSAN